MLYPKRSLKLIKNGYLVKADSPENVSLVVMPQAGLVLLAVLAVAAGPAPILGGHVAVVLPRVAEVLKG